MRKLADYSFMLRDFKLAQSTYDLLRSDFEHDKAWKHYAGANEMCLVATLLNPSSRSRQDSIERWLEGACHSYIHRCNSPFYALRTLLLAAECLKYRGSLGVDEPAAWAAKILEMNLAGPVGNVLITERIASFFAQKKVVAPLSIGTRNRKRGFWSLLAAEAWVRMGKSVQAERCLEDVKADFGISNMEAQSDASDWMAPLLQELQESIVTLRLENLGLDLPSNDDVPTVEEEVSEELGFRANRRSVIEGAAVLQADGGLEATSLTPVRTREIQSVEANEGFE
jgi:trafficking protein particle complex subunit 8